MAASDLSQGLSPLFLAQRASVIGANPAANTIGTPGGMGVPNQPPAVVGANLQAPNAPINNTSPLFMQQRASVFAPKPVSQTAISSNPTPPTQQPTSALDSFISGVENTVGKVIPQLNPANQVRPPVFQQPPTPASSPSAGKSTALDLTTPTAGASGAVQPQIPATSLNQTIAPKQAPASNSFGIPTGSIEATPAPTLWNNISTFLQGLTGQDTTSQTALAQNAYAISKNPQALQTLATPSTKTTPGSPPPSLLDLAQFGGSPLKNSVMEDASQKLGLRSYPTNSGLANIVMAAGMVTGLAEAPIVALKAGGIFGVINTAKSAFISALTGGKGNTFSALVPNANPTVKNVLDVMDFLTTSAITGAIFKGAPVLFDKMTKDVITKYNMPPNLNITAEGVRNIATGADNTVVNPADKQAIAQLGLTSSQWRKAATDGISVTFPTEKVVTVQDKPFWGKVKEFVKLPATNSTVVTKTPGSIDTFGGYLPSGEATPNSAIPVQTPIEMPGKTDLPIESTNQPVTPQTAENPLTQPGIKTEMPTQYVPPEGTGLKGTTVVPTEPAETTTPAIQINRSVPTADSPQVLQQLDKAIVNYQKDSGVYTSPTGEPKMTPALSELSNLATDPTVMHHTQIQVGLLPKNPDGTITLYRGGTPSDGAIGGQPNRLVSAAYDLKSAQNFVSDQPSDQRVIQKFEVQPSDIKVFIGGGEAEVLVPAHTVVNQPVTTPAVGSMSGEGVPQTPSDRLVQYYKSADSPALQQAWYEVMAELEVAAPGKRVFNENGEVTGAQSSTFPSWLPSDVRKTSLLQKTFDAVKDPTKLNYPPASMPARRALFDAILGEIDSRAGTDSSTTLEHIKESHDSQIQTTQKNSAYSQNEAADHLSITGNTEAGKEKSITIPKVLYHGTLENFDTFSSNTAGKNTGYDNARFGIFFVDKPQLASDFVEKTRLEGDVRPLQVKKVSVDIKNPLDLTTKGIFTNARQAPVIVEMTGGEKGLSPTQALAQINEHIDMGNISEVRQEIFSDIKNKAIMQAAGYDGIVENYGDSSIAKPVLEYVAFSPDQVHEVNASQVESLDTQNPAESTSEPRKGMTEQPVNIPEKLPPIEKSTEKGTFGIHTPFVKLMEDDLKPKGGLIKESIGNIYKEIATTLNPVGSSPMAATDIVMKNKGEYEQKLFHTERNFRKIKEMWDKQPEKARLAFMAAIEDNSAHVSPELKSLADMYRTRLNNAYAVVSQWKEVPFLENFFPHFWTKPDEVSKGFVPGIQTKGPLSGTKSFLKHRVFADIQEGLAFTDAKGNHPYKLVTSNPEELVQLFEQNVAKFDMAQNIKQDMIKQGMWKFVKSGDKAPDGWAAINDQVTKVYFKPTMTEYYDQVVMDKLNVLADSLGIAHERVIGGTKGFGQEKAGISYTGENKIMTKFASPEQVLLHELGHQIDGQYHLQRQVLNNPTFNSQLKALAEERFNNPESKVEPSDKFKAYATSAPEKMAVMFESYLHAPDLFKEKAPDVYKWFEDFMGSHEALSPILDIKPSLVLGTNKVENGAFQLAGEYYAKEGAARILNNYLSRNKIQDSAIGKGLMYMKNTMNAFELGFSGFHITAEALNSMYTKFGNGLIQLTEGHPIAATRLLAQTPFAPFLYFREGQKFYNGDKSLASLETDLFTGGAKLSKNTMYKNNTFDIFRKNLREGNLIGATFRAPMAAIEAVSKPIFDYYVPYLKVGAFRDMMAIELQRRTQEMENGETTRAKIAREIWGNVENRFGMLNYDNLFWNGTVKGANMMMWRAVGWNLGDVRELGGGFTDTAKMAQDILKGKQVHLSQKQSFLLSLMFLTAALGSIYECLHTGKVPASVRDMYEPKNGAYNTDGTAQRIVLPTYLKDLYSFSTNPKQTVANKLSPEFSAIVSILQNQDYYKNYVYNPNDNLPLQSKQVGLFMINQFQPFSLGQIANQRMSNTPVPQQVESFFGILKAPKDISQADWQKTMGILYDNQMGGHAAQTPEQQYATQLKQEARRELQKGDTTTLNRLIQLGVLNTPRSVQTFVRDASMTGDQRMFKSLSIPNKQKVLQAIQQSTKK